MPDPRDVTIIIATRDRRATLLATLGQLRALAGAPPTIVVDNASTDGTADAVAARHPDVEVVRLDENVGAGARNVGLRAATTPLVAFCDDDSWWARGALDRARRHFADHPDLGLLGARILVGPDERLDPTCVEMARGETPPGRPGPPVRGFVACGVVARRDALLAVGGFEERFGIGGEETLLAMDLAAAGWTLAYAEDVVAHHHPTASGPRPGRNRVMVRNDLWTAWLRRPLRVAVGATLGALRPSALPGLVDAVAGGGWVVRERRRLPPDVEAQFRALARTAAVR